jgi:hypothetical protein
VARDHVVISGTGYNDNVTGVGAAPQLRGTLLSLHFYGFWASDTEKSAWLANLAPRIGSYASRTIIDEAGAPMTIGLNYGAHNGNTSTAYFAALTETARANHMGIVYWPGLRFGDSYSIESVGADGHLVNNSVSGVAQLRWGWGFGTTEPENDDPAAPPGEALVHTASGRCLDVPGFSTTDGTALDLWDCNGGGNQSFNWETNGEITVYASKCLTAGASVTIAPCTGAAGQQWTLTAAQTVTSVADPTLCLDSPSGTNGGAVVVATCSGAASQLWSKG